MWWKQRGARGLRQLLLAEWDPIGVRDGTGGDDEYDSYLGPIAERLRSGASAEEISAYLKHVTYGRMATTQDPEVIVTAAQRIVEWYVEEMERARA
jgi:hypothetical protein